MITEIEYNVLMERIEELLKIVSNETPKTNKEAIELNVISDLVAEYEEKYFPIKLPSLNSIIVLKMNELNLSQKKTAELIGVSESRFSDYLKGKAEPTLKIARNIAQKLNIEPSIVLGIG